MNQLDYCSVRDHTERLAAPLSPEDQTVQTMPDVSPTKWHRAHTTWFFETFVLGDDAGYEPYDPAYSYLFNSYYEAVGARHPRPQRGLLSRPGAGEIGRYRSAVDAAMNNLLASGRAEKFGDLVQLGLHHEQQHQELLLMDAKHVLGTNLLAPVYAEAPASARRPADTPDAAGGAGWIGHDGGVVAIGHEGNGFAYDNETPRHEALLRPHAVAGALVTSGEWLAFMADGGYQRPDLWMSDGWIAVTTERWEAPLYWHRSDDEPNAWEVFTLHGRRPVDPAEPVVHVSWYEADAFARWCGCRLPSEAEWERAAPPAEPGEAVPNGGVLHPRAGGGGWYEQVWQWTESPYCAYPGFRPAAGAVGEYNGKFMVNQMSLRGSACVTSPAHARRTYRNFFPPSARWAFSGLRLARDEG